MSFSSSSLTQGAISQLVGMKSASENKAFQPTLQILSIKNIGPQNQSGADRYRVVLSDSQQFIQGMLASQVTHLVDGQLQELAVVKITDFMCNHIQGRTLCIVLGIQVLGTATERLGQPAEIRPGSTSAAAPPPAPMYNRTNTAAVPSTAGSANPYSAASPHKVARAPIVPRSSVAGGVHITPIAQLNMYQNQWTIKARVVSKSDIRTWSNAKGEGSLFSMELLDSSGMDIRATLFKEAVDKFYNMLQVGSVYTISKGRLKVANMQYNTCKSQFEMTLDPNSEIVLCDDTGDIQAQSFDFTKIGQLESVEQGKNVDVMGIVQECSEVQSLTSKKTGQELQKADVTIIDDTGVQVRVTLWGQQAVSAPQEMVVGQPVAFRRCRVSDYGGKSLSGPQSAFVNPKVPETQDLMDWWKSQGSRGAPVKSLSRSGGVGGSMDPLPARKHIADIKGQQLGHHSEKGDFLSFKANFTFFKKDKEGGAWYTACPNKEEPCRNRCKVTPTTDGNWQCERCQGTYPSCTRRWIFSGVVADDTASTWVSLFDDQAVTLLNGATADEVFSRFEDQDAYDSCFEKATYTEWVLKCRVKNEMVNGEPRTKTTVVRMDPVDYVADSHAMLGMLEKWMV
eukprot:Nitzschia sp. Nitz4//scaffold36_size144017//30182//32050//NITZ4_003070-RA/size144017-processed-gene-0.222-mRNA-1//1//CDS//3329549408//6900//frame0